MEVISDYGLRIPLTIISEIMGVGQADAEKFHRWMKSILALTSAPNPLLGIPNLWAIQRFLRRTIKDRRINPHDDLITALVQAQEAGHNLTQQQPSSTHLIL